MINGLFLKQRETIMEKPHQNKLWLAEQVADGKNSKQIADEQNVSYKLVETYLRKFDIPHTPRKG
jgi:DNA-binding NarL/FixJ family response regulator